MGLVNHIKDNIARIRSVRSNQPLKYEGFIELELVNRQNGVTVRRTIKNTITPAGKQMFLAHSAARMLQMSGDVLGNMATLSALSRFADNTSWIGVRRGNSDRDITNLLLNLSDPSKIQEGDTYIPLLSAAGEKSNAATVVGYANNNTIPAADGKEGVSDYCLPEYLVDGKTVAKRWKYDKGVATGTINAVAMAPHAVFRAGIQGLGVRTAKCIDRVNVVHTGFGLFSNGFCPPGIGGITTDDELLLNYSQNGSDQHKANLSTGITTDITSNWPGLPVPRGIQGRAVTDYWYDGSRYLYVLDSNGTDGAEYRWYCTVYDTQGGVISYVTNFMVGVNSSNNYAAGAYFLYHGGQLYVSFLQEVPGQIQFQYQYGMRKLNMGAQGYYGGLIETQLDYSTIGFNQPAGLDIRDFALKSLANGRYALIVRGLPQVTASGESTDYSAGGQCNRALIFTDLTNPIGSVVGVLEWLPRNSVIVSTPTRTGVLSIGVLNSKSAQSQAYDAAGGTVYVQNTSNPSPSSGQYGGVWWSEAEWSSNVISYVKLPEPVVKTDNEELYVTYGYKIT